MSRSTYGVLAYRQPFPEDATSKEIVDKSKELAKALAATLKANGGEFSTLKEVFQVSKSMADDPELGLGSSDFETATRED